MYICIYLEIEKYKDYFIIYTTYHKCINCNKRDLLAN